MPERAAAPYSALILRLEDYAFKASLLSISATNESGRNAFANFADAFRQAAKALKEKGTANGD